MQRKSFFHLTMAGILLVTLTGISCNNDNKPARNTPYFSWTIDGVTYVADDATAYTNDIEATKTVGSVIKHVEVAVHSANDFPVGTYTMGPATNVIGTWDGTNTGAGYYSMSGTLHITASTPDEISGDFSVVLSTGTSTVMTGTFTNVPLQ